MHTHTTLRRIGKIFTCCILGVAIFLIALCFLPNECSAKSYHISELHIIAKINHDGSMDVSEHRTFNFNGDFTWVTQVLSLEGCSGISDIMVSEGGRDYILADSGEGTFSCNRVYDTIEVTWRYKASNEKRTFTLSYKVNDVVLVHEDVAELYWKFIGDAWEVHSENILIELYLPDSFTETQDEMNKVRAWGHGPLSGEVQIVPPNKITWTVDFLPPETFLEGRIVFPKSMVPKATRTSGVARLNFILEQEERWAKEANRTRQIQRALLPVSVVCLVACVVSALLLQLRFGREHKPEFEGDYYREPPGDYTPAELGYLWNFKKIKSEDIAATILDLARKGFLRIEVTKDEKDVLGFLSRGTFLRAGKSFVARRTNRNTGRKMRPVVVFRVSNMNPSTHLENEVVAGRKRL
ncbi:MAG: DUF2207 domain-containing protein [Firmicutes bacterium]|nr:DUF2207 domain-containing protein [Candidatus Fermentithermobacillaceae bacterium]